MPVKRSQILQNFVHIAKIADETALIMKFFQKNLQKPLAKINIIV